MSNSRFIVAIDFGTTHSGFAHVHKSNPSHVEALYAWEDAPASYSKTLTALLYDAKKNHTSWGYTAHRDYLSLSQHLRGSHTLVTKFKLFLDEAYKDKLPEGFNVLSMIGDYLKCMKEKISDTLSLKFGSTFSIEDVQWCLTVPAIWSDRAKDTMRRAAVKAGIIDSISSTKLSIILEPEAAAVHIGKSMQGILKDKDVFMVLDAGGGTVDLTLHQMNDDRGAKKFIEVAPGIGKSCGSTFIDDNFLKFYREKVGEKAFDNAKVKRPLEIFSLLKNWEPLKRSFCPKNTKGASFMPIPNFIYTEMSKKRKQKLGVDQDGFDDCVFLKQTDILSFFDPVIQEIIDLVEKMIKQSTKKVNKILCVGGFSDSRYLIHRVREHFEQKNIEVICPPDPGSVVLKGAVQYGLQPSIINARRSRRTYGISVGKIWNESFPKSRRHWDFLNERWMVHDVFDKLVEVGEEISSDKKVIRLYSPGSNFQTRAGIKLYATKEKYPRFTDSAECYLLGEIVIPLEMDEDMDPDNYLLPVLIHFGATEIFVKVRNHKKNEEHVLCVNYDTGVDETATPIG